MSESEKPPMYVEHPGTIRVAGASKPLQVVRCAQGLLSTGRDPIEFFYIGGNAGQQAMKAMTTLAFQIERESCGQTEALFKPIRVMTLTTDDATRSEKEKDATVWRLTLVSK